MATEQGDGDDPFDGLTLDDDFVASAEISEQSAEDRVARLQRIDREHRALAAEREQDRKAAAATDRRLRKRRQASGVTTGTSSLKRWRTVVVLVVLVGLFVYVTFLRDRGSDSSSSSAPAASAPSTSGADPPFSLVLAGGQPPAGYEESPAPLGHPSDPGAVGPHAFLEHQVDGTSPITYDPCRPIHYVMNPQNAPPDGEQLVSAAMARLSAATGFSIVYDGVTDEPFDPDRGVYDAARYPDRWAPVLVSWLTPGQWSGLDGDAVAFGGSSRVDVPKGSVYVSGVLRLDAADLAQAEAERGPAAVQSTIQHELGHLVDLAHVDDPTQLMNPQARRDVLDYAQGDLQGLAIVGQSSCYPDV